MRNWLFYRDYSGDIIVEQNCHNLDVVNWFLGAKPAKTAGCGGRAVRKEPGNIMDNLSLTYEYPDGTVFSYAASQFTAGGFSDVGETFFCEKGTIRTSRAGYELWNKDQRGAPPELVETKGDITADAVNAFIDGARNGNIENAGIYAVESTLTAIMGREAIYSGKPMNWSDLKVNI
jgi:predicted dehydrogenase